MIRGLVIDLDLAAAAENADKANRAASLREMAELTGLANPNSQPQHLGWVREQGLKSAKDLTADTVTAMRIKCAKVGSPKARRLDRVLGLRQDIALATGKKYTAMRERVCLDGRLASQFKFYGAGATGLSTPEGSVRVQNLSRTSLGDQTEPSLCSICCWVMAHRRRRCAPWCAQRFCSTAARWTIPRSRLG